MSASMEGFISAFTGDVREVNTKGGLVAYFGDFSDGMSLLVLNRKKV